MFSFIMALHHIDYCVYRHFVQTRDISARFEKIGTIEVKAWEASKSHEKKIYEKGSDGSGQDDYDQAMKDDAKEVTNGSYLMATTAVGRLHKAQFAGPGTRTVQYFNMGRCLGVLELRYDMKETLQSKGVIPENPKRVIAVIDLTGEDD